MNKNPASIKCFSLILQPIYLDLSNVSKIILSSRPMQKERRLDSSFLNTLLKIVMKSIIYLYILNENSCKTYLLDLQINISLYLRNHGSLHSTLKNGFSLFLIVASYTSFCWIMILSIHHAVQIGIDCPDWWRSHSFLFTQIIEIWLTPRQDERLRNRGSC